MRKVSNASESAGISTGASFNSYQFDFGLGAGSKGSSNAPLKDQKPTGSYSQPWSKPLAPKTGPSQASTGWSQFQSASSGRGSQSEPPEAALGGNSLRGGGSSTTSQTWADYKPMTQQVGGTKPMSSQPLGGLKSMNSAVGQGYRPSVVAKLAAAGIAGVTETKSTDVFGDLLGAALNASNSPLNKATPKSSSSSFSMKNLRPSLPQTSEEPVRQATPQPSGASKSTEHVARTNDSSSSRGSLFPDISGGPSSSFSDDVFSFGGTSSTPDPAARVGSAYDPFGLAGSSSGTGGSGRDPFAVGVQSGNSCPAPQRKPSSPMPDPFDVFALKQPPASQKKMADPMDSLFSMSGPPPSKAPPPRPSVAADDGWGIFGGGSRSAFSGGGTSEPSTTELEGLPPPPAGVNAESACSKGTDFYKNGQFPDAIKWLTWSIQLANGEKELTVKILTNRGSCFKEIGEMKKAVGDCTKAIELKPKDTNLIVQRASLYESMEKYKLALADLKLVTQVDPSNRAVLGTLVRLQKLVDQ